MAFMGRGQMPTFNNDRDDIQDIIDLVLLTYQYFFGEMFSILYIIILFAINRDLAKADNPIKYKESTDWFYEKYEKKKEE